MTDTSDDDWRLNGQEPSLTGAVLVRKTYQAPSPDWDHDHCEFCWAKFMEADGPDIQRVGYNTVEGADWICETCFNDFKARFGWTVQT